MSSFFSLYFTDYTLIKIDFLFADDTLQFLISRRELFCVGDLKRRDVMDLGLEGRKEDDV